MGRFDESAVNDSHDLVFRGFDESFFPLAKIALVLGVSTAKLDAWCKGRTPIPAAKLAFLTLLLADRLDQLDELGAEEESQIRPVVHNDRDHWVVLKLETARRCLRAQEAHVAKLPPAALREGEKLFRAVWGNHHARRGNGAPASAQLKWLPS